MPFFLSSPSASPAFTPQSPQFSSINAGRTKSLSFPNSTSSSISPPPLAMATPRTPPPPPVIGKAGSFTVFITHPPSDGPRSRISSPLPSPSASTPEKETPLPVMPPPPASPPPVAPTPLVQVPPLQFEKTAAKSSGSAFGLFWDAVARVQNAHSNLDECLADWFGLNQSKYQWALNDYYENSGKEKESGKPSKSQELVNKVQAV